MLTYQDFEAVKDNEKKRLEFIADAIKKHRQSDEVKIAYKADAYNEQKNTFIKQFVKAWYDHAEFEAVPLASNFFFNLNTQRCAYSLGNGLTFSDAKTKEKLGNKIDNVIFKGAYNALIHGRSFFFFNVNSVATFAITEFVPLVDEETSELRAGIRYWQNDEKKPTFAVVYEEDGFTKYKGNTGYGEFEEHTPKRGYKLRTSTTKAFGTQIDGEENYGSLPIVQMWGTKLHQSTLIGLKEKIDMFDIVQSGFADNVATVQQIYWLFENAGGMKPEDYKKFRDDLRIDKIANVNGTLTDGVKVTPYQTAVPTDAHKNCLAELRSSLYEDFGAIDVHTISAGATNDHIAAAYQPMDLRADDFEYQIIEAVEKLLAFAGVEGEDATPQFKRNRIANEREMVEMLMLVAEYLDDETILKKVPFITPDELEEITKRKAETDMSRFGNTPTDEDTNNNQDDVA